MRSGSSFWPSCTLFLFLLVAGNASASDTNVFRVNSSLKGSTFLDGSVESLKIGADSDSPLLSGIGGQNYVAVSIHDTECLMMGIQPTVRLVAFNGSQIVAPLVEFANLIPIFVGDKQVILQAEGFPESGIDDAEMDALITLSYEPCTTLNAPTSATRVDIRPLGTYRPRRVLAGGAPLFANFGELEISSDDPSRPSILVPLRGRPTTLTTDCNIDINPSALSFGSVMVGSVTTNQLQIRNNGQNPCTVSNLTQFGSVAFKILNPLVSATNLNPGTSITLNVTFTPLVPGADGATFTITGSDPENPQQIIAVTGNGTTTTTECILSVSPLALNFGAVEIGTNKTLEVTVTNSGGMGCLVDRTTLVGHAGFSHSPIATTGMPIVVSANTSVVVSVTFTPSNTTSAKGTLEFDSLAADGTSTNLTLVSLSATGIVAQCRLEFDPTVLDFGAVAIGTNRSVNINIANTGLTNCTISALSVSNAAFALIGAPSAPFDIPVGSNIDLTVDFMPSAAGTTNGTLLVTFDNPVTTNLIALIGFGIDQVTGCMITSSQSNGFHFGNITVGKTNVLKATISNPGTTNCTIESISLVGSNDLALIAPPTPIDLAPNAQFEIAIRYRPQMVGIAGGELRILSTSEDITTQVIPVTGTGVLVRCQLEADVAMLDFGDVLVSSNETLSVFLINTNSINCSVSSIGIMGGNGAFALDPRVLTSRFIMIPGQTNEIPVIFTALSQGTNNATLRIESDDSVAPVDVSLTGVGLRCHLAVAPTSLNFGDVTVKSTNTLTLTLSNTGNIDCNIEGLTVLGSGRFFVTSPVTNVPAFGEVQVDIEYRPENLQTIIIEGGNLRSTGNPTRVP